MNEPWSLWEPMDCKTEYNCFCESLHYGNWVLQPVNTYTNLIFIFFGILILYRIKKGIDLKTDFPAYLLSGSLILLGFGSFFMHASFTRLGHIVDVGAMFILVNIFTFYQLKKLYNVPFYLANGLVSLLCVLGLIFLKEFMKGKFELAIVLAAIVSIIFYRKYSANLNKKFVLLGTLCFITSLTCFFLDAKRIICYPNSLFQLHSFWHILNGIAIYLFYKGINVDLKNKPIVDNA